MLMRGDVGAGEARRIRWSVAKTEPLRKLEQARPGQPGLRCPNQIGWKPGSRARCVQSERLEIR